MKKSARTNLRKRRKALFVERMGGKCSICGYNKCINSLVFHHINKNDKNYEPAQLMNFSIKKIESELKKCVLICANCHGELHSEKYDYKINVQKYIREWVEIECKFCHTNFSTMNKNRVYCSQKCSDLALLKVPNRPTKDELKELISNNTWVDIGRMFSVSDNAVRKWAKKYKLI